MKSYLTLPRKFGAEIRTCRDAVAAVKKVFRAIFQLLKGWKVVVQDDGVSFDAHCSVEEANILNAAPQSALCYPICRTHVPLTADLSTAVTEPKVFALFGILKDTAPFDVAVLNPQNDVLFASDPIVAQEMVSFAIRKYATSPM